jgi:hypothetical protein
MAHGETDDRVNPAHYSDAGAPRGAQRTMNIFSIEALVITKPVSFNCRAPSVHPAEIGAEREIGATGHVAARSGSLMSFSAVSSVSGEPKLKAA